MGLTVPALLDPSLHTDEDVPSWLGIRVDWCINNTVLDVSDENFVEGTQPGTSATHSDENPLAVLRCRWCNGIIERGPGSETLYRDLMGGWLCSTSPAEAVERHHRP